MLHCSKTTVSTTICRNAQGTAPKRNAHDVATKGVLYVKNYDTPQLSPTPASTSAMRTITLPRSRKDNRIPRRAIREEGKVPSIKWSAKAPNACRPTCATPAPPDPALTGFVTALCVSELPFVFGYWLVSKFQFPLHGGQFRGLASVAHVKLVKDRG